MQNKMELLRLILATALMAALPFTAKAQDKATFIVTSDTDIIYPVLSFDEDLRGATERFEAKLKELHEKHPDAILMDVGNNISLSVTLETTYQSGIPYLANEMNFAAVNMGPRDVLVSSSLTSSGFQLGEDELIEPIVTNLDVTWPEPVGFKPVRTLDKEGIVFIAANHPKAASAMAGKLTFLSETEPQTLRDAAKKGREEKHLVVGMTTMPQELLEAAFPDEATRPHLVFMLNSKEKEPRQWDAGWVVPAPGRGRIMVLETEKSEDGTPREPTISYHVYMKPEEMAQLPQYPMMRRAMAIGNVEQVLPGFFDEQNAAVRVERIPPERVAEYTTVKQPTVHHVKSEGKNLRVYRVIGDMPDFRGRGWSSEPGWPTIDMLVVVTEDHQFSRVISRVNFPMVSEPTTILEALNKLRGKKPEDWAPDPDLTRGAEMLWEWGVHEIKTVLEMDRMLFAEADPVE